MKLRNLILITATALTGTIAATAALAGPSMNTHLKSTTLSEEDCLDVGRKAVRGAGFTTNFEVAGNTVFGERDDYTVALVCATSKEVVFFVVAGPSSKMTKPYLDDILDRF